MASISGKSIRSRTAFVTTTLSFEIAFVHDSHNRKAFQFLENSVYSDPNPQELSAQSLWPLKVESHEPTADDLS